MTVKAEIVAVDLEWQDKGATTRKAFGIDPAGDNEIVGEFKDAAESIGVLGKNYEIIEDEDWIKREAGKILSRPHIQAEICKVFDAGTQILVVEVHFFDGRGSQMVRYEVRRQNRSAPLEISDQEGRALGAAGEWITRETRDKGVALEPDAGVANDGSIPRSTGQK